jgi:hypothetical protein
MIKATIHFQRNGVKDDILRIYDSDTEGVVRVVMAPGDFKTSSNEFFISSSKAVRLVSDILRSLPYDVEPFEYIQITTELTPSILYHVTDIETSTVRHLIEDVIDNAIHTKVRRVSA